MPVQISTMPQSVDSVYLSIDDSSHLSTHSFSAQLFNINIHNAVNVQTNNIPTVYSILYWAGTSSNLILCATYAIIR